MAGQDSGADVWRLRAVLTLVIWLIQNVVCQSNNNPIIPGSYYMDSNADCNGPVREIYGQQVRVIGHGAIQEQLSPQSCSLTLRSQANFEHTNLRLQVVAATIRDCNVRFTIYDGDPGQGTLRGYDCGSVNKPNERDFVTTGDTVSFILERRDSTNTLFDIEVFVTPAVSGSDPGSENNNGEDWGIYREKLHNDAAVGIVGAVFIVAMVLACLGILLCYCRYKGLNKPWEQHQLATFRPVASIYETKSRMSDVSSGVHETNASVAARSRVESEPRRRMEPSRHMARPSEDEDSVFNDDASDIPPKKRLMDQDRRWERERERERRERERQRQHGRDFATQNSSYVQADDDHPQDTFVERIIEPRVKSRRQFKPPSYDEAVHETETSEHSESESEQISEGKEEEESEEEPKTSEEEGEAETDEEDGAAPAPARSAAQAARPPRQQLPQPPPPPLSQPQQVAMPAYPGFPTMAYGPMGYPVAPAQFVMAAPGPAFMGPGHPPPRYPGDRSQAPPPLRPTDPPVYSYLVQRGYQPLDLDRSRSANTSHSHGSLEELDRNAAASGVEYMRR